MVRHADITTPRNPEGDAAVPSASRTSTPRGGSMTDRLLADPAPDAAHPPHTELWIQADERLDELGL